MTEKVREPDWRLRDGNLKAAGWDNEHEGRSYHNVRFTRTYRGSNGQLQENATFGQNDLLRLSKLAERAHETIRKRREAQRSERPAQEQQAPEARRTRQRDQGHGR